MGFFTDATDLIADDRPMAAYGACVFDADGDGADEIFVCGFGGPNRLLKWDGTRLVDADDVAGLPIDAEGMAIGCAAGDLDGDGREELYVLNTDVFGGAKKFTDRLYSRGEDGRWRDLFADDTFAAVLNLTAGRSVAAIDRFGTGRYGFLLASYGGPSVLYEMDAAGRLFETADTAGLAVTTGGRSLAVGPWLAAGSPDVFLGTENDANVLATPGADRVYFDVARKAGVADPATHARGVAAVGLGVDVLGPRFALAVTNWEGPNRLWVPMSTTTAPGRSVRRFVDRAFRPFSRPGRARTLMAGDFDGDGRPEVFAQFIGEPNRLFRLGPDEQWEPLDPGPATEPDGLGTGGCWGDFDGDGVLELLLTHGEQGLQRLTLYKVSSPKPTLRVRARLRSGAPARHATVTAGYADGQTACGVIDAGSGYLCQMSPVAVFAADPPPAWVKVDFPGGQTATVRPDGPGDLIVMPGEGVVTPGQNVR